ncbi:MAG TPA: HAD family phosphatase [Candidatus Saccharimonadales bacterium]|jgi:putative hydrolase of the HAD superfamily
MIRAIIFDCYGVLVTDALFHLLDPLFSQDPSAHSRIRGILGMADAGLITSDEASAKIAAEIGLSPDEYRRKTLEGEVKDQQLLDYIENLRRRYKTGMLTNIPKGNLARRFTSAELTRYFDVTIASGEIGSAKPDHEAYETVAERLGAEPEECVFIDDRQRYIDGARAVGMQAILYQNFLQFRGQLEALLANS